MCINNGGVSCSIPAGSPGFGQCITITQGNSYTGFDGNGGACGAYTCNGASGTCESSCAQDSDCVASDYCNAAGQCMTQIGLGMPCNRTVGGDCKAANCRDCASGYCVSNGTSSVCCNGPCNSQCAQCSGVYATQPAGTCAPASEGFPGAPQCTVNTCNGSSQLCPTANACATDLDCQGGYYCNAAGNCVTQKAQGALCNTAQGADCKQSGGCRVCGTMGGCVNGFCCDASCNGGGCQRCDGATQGWSGATNGTCKTAAAGTSTSACGNYLCTGAPTCPINCSDDTGCATSYYCGNDGLCHAQRANGVACAAGDCKAAGCRECQNGNCAQNYCCDQPCSGGACQACNGGDLLWPGAANGTCKMAPSSWPGSPSCGAYYCSGASATCPMSCTGDGQCQSNYYCSGGRCVAQLANGTACVATDQCLSGLCVDGVCCDKACAGQCDACNVPTSQGTCTNVGGNGFPACNGYLCSGSSPNCPASCTSDAQCQASYYCATGGTCQPQKMKGQTCSLTGDCAVPGNCRECATGNCVDTYCCDTPCAGNCDVCNGAVPGTCSQLAAGSAGTPSCSPYVCSGSAASCPSSCTSDSQCASGNYCSGTACVPLLALGRSCSTGNQCVSTFCANGVCCSAACNGNCQQCNTTTGQCQNITGPGNPSCAPYVCSGASGGCPSSCTTDALCASTDYCNGTSCVMKLATGSTCSGANQCASGFCSDGSCCDKACAGGCDVCAISLGATADGTCTIITTGTGMNPSCAPKTCVNGVGGNCPGACTDDTGCTPTTYCDTSGACLPQLGNGSVCSRARQCTSGNCVDGYCCDTACAGGCDVCNQPGSTGTCTKVSAGTVGQNPSCGNYLCGGGASCPTTCATDSNCATGTWCSGNQCVAPLAQGTACTRARQCATGFCASGFCCNSACAGGCNTCSATAGTCTVLAQGAAGNGCGSYLCDGTNGICPMSCTLDGDCALGSFCNSGSCAPSFAAGSACTGARQCSSNVCLNGVCCAGACGGSAGPCQNCSNPTGACVSSAAGSPGAPPCSPYLCSGSATCPTSCAGDANCIATDWCNAGACVARQINGAPCSAPDQCASGLCANGFCCNAMCNDGCDRCDLAGSTGTCTPVAPGTPSAACSPYLCNGAGTSCPNRCTVDGDCIASDFCNAGVCTTKLNPGTLCSSANQCASNFCVGGVCCMSACAGACQQCASGTCGLSAKGAPGSPSCTPLTCDGGNPGCPSQCFTDVDCIGGYFCNGGTCTPKYPTGNSCSGNNQCGSGFCVSGTCCNVACGGACQSCAGGSCATVTAGSPSPSCAPLLCDGSSTGCPTSCSSDASCAAGFYCATNMKCVSKQSQGAPCSASDQCALGFCVGGVCCDQSCTGACQSCSAPGKIGTCSNVSGTSNCGAYVCSGSSPICPTSCASDADCSTGNWCNGAACVPGQTSGQPCTRAAQCATTFCVSGFCCGTACSLACQACNVNPGTCTPAPVGSSGTPSCGAILCDGTSTTCPSACSRDSDCASGFWCSGTSCIAVEGIGQPCARGTQCASGFCAGGTCCNVACTGNCQSCSTGTCTTDQKGTQVGACAPYLCDGSNPGCPSSCAGNGDCVATSYCNATSQCNGKQPAGAPCGTPSECTSNFCVAGICCNSACAGVCDSCASGSCQPAAAGTPSSCAPYVCNGVNASCPMACANDGNCATGDYCDAGGACQSQKASGQSCGSGHECTSGFCADGVCCNAPCGGPCDVCTLALGATADGVCTPAPVGSAGAPSCAPFLCDGTNATCPSSCLSDGDCAASDWCSMGRCTGKLPAGQGCSAADQCTSGQCVDGVCCNSACAGACDRCDANPGVCTPVPAGSVGAPSCGMFVCDGSSPSCPTMCGNDANCSTGNYCAANACVPAQANGSSCSETRACASGFCAGGTCCNAACAGSCQSCTGGMCATVGAGQPGTPSCAPYLCNGTLAGCPPSCAQDMDCAANNFCNGTQCAPLLMSGSICVRASECASGFCVGGYCCGSACSGGCQTCSATPGMCTVLPMLSPGSCGEYVCDGASTDCPTSCTMNTQCASGAYCNSTGACITKQPIGSSCTQSTDCLQGFCVGGVCCASACSQPCQTCNKMGGTPGLCASAPPGTSGTCGAYACNGNSPACPSACTFNSDCNTMAGYNCIFGQCVQKVVDGGACAMGTDCASGSCKNNICCHTPCTGDCEVCAAGTGNCTALTSGDPNGTCAAKPHDLNYPACRAQCGAAGVCTYPDSSTACTASMCADATDVQPAGACNSAGGCTLPPTMSCGAYVCTGAACATNCVDNTVCNTAAGDYCANGVCGLHQMIGHSCALDSDCDSGHCADGVCCDRACSGCYACNLAGHAGTCTVALGADPHSNCKGQNQGVCVGACDANAKCVYPGPEKACDICKACNSQGGCNSLPSSGDDAKCGTVACGALSSECVTFADLTAMRCVSLGLCAASNDPSVCTSMQSMPDGTPCSLGACMNGQCVAASVDGGAPPSGGHGGCAMAARAPAPYGVFLLLIIFAIARRRRDT
jgi:hypothetical protein